MQPPQSSQTDGAGLVSGELLALRLPHSGIQSHVLMEELPVDGGGTIPGLGVLLGSAYPTGQECISLRSSQQPEVEGMNSALGNQNMN